MGSITNLLKLQEATHPGSADAPGFRLHPLKGDRAGEWSVRVSGNWRVVFRFEDGEAVDSGLGRLSLTGREHRTMNNNKGERVGPMLNPPRLGELIRESMEETGWNVTETAARLNCERPTLSRLLNGKAGVSATMALSLENIGWGTAEHWMRMQASYELHRRVCSGRTRNSRRRPRPPDPHRHKRQPCEPMAQR